MSPVVIVLLLLIAGLAAWLLWQMRGPVPKSKPGKASGSKPKKQAQAAPVPYSRAAIDAAIADCYRLAFGVTSGDAPSSDTHVDDEHGEVLARVGASIDLAVHEPEYFPRRPMLLPKLLRALNDSDSTRQELVGLILEDPSLAGNVLRRANSALYRISPARVDSLDRAVVNLGTEGLKALVGTAILQPVFRLRTGLFDQFATITWEQAQRASIAAETYAKTTRTCDPFVAQLLGVLKPLAHIVLFKLTLERYREKPDVVPRAEVFIRAIQEHSSRVAHLVASTWELPDTSLNALGEQQRRLPPSTMSPLGRAVYFGDLCGTLAVLAKRDMITEESAQALLKGQGLSGETAQALWYMATTIDTEV